MKKGTDYRVVISKEEFLSKQLKDISQVYSGKRDCCRCGCGGEYISTSFANEPRSDVNDELVLKRLIRAKNLVKKGAEVMEGETYIDVKTGNNRTLTFYFDEIKNKN